ncbi:zinc-binding dehydrogenase, partial [Escherichia coli]|uniref:zinc-binding dehydrogenase n=7 Tax=Enterobacterales TaxID=91347 RepID=UPI001F49C44F
PNDTSVGEISVKTGNNARNGGKNSLNRLIRCVCGKKIGPDPRNFNQRVSLGRNDLLIRTFLNSSEMSAPQMQSVLRELRFNQLILETAGVPQTVELAVEIAGPHAQLALVGTLHQDLHLTSATFGKILRKELTVIGSWMNYSSPWPGQEWETASRLLTERKLSLEPLIAHRGSFESFAQAVRDIARNAMPGKVLLIP